MPPLPPPTEHEPPQPKVLSMPDDVLHPPDDSDRLSRDALALRYGDQAAPAVSSIPWNPVLDTVLSHRSVRRYSDRPLPQGLIELLVAAAQSAPSSSNLQAMSIVAVEDRARILRLAKLAAGQRHVAEAPLLLMFVADLSRLRDVSTSVGQPGEGLDYTETFIVAVADAAFAAQNAIIALESLGLGGCYIGAMRNHPREVAAELGLPPGAFVVFGLTIGYPDPTVETGVKPRLAQSVVLHRERYQPADAADIASYDETLRAFRVDQLMSDTAWSRQAALRVRGPDSLMGRDTLRATLQAMGFALK
jgi:nitroreductase